MHTVLNRILTGCMQGRTMYVLPYLMGPPKSPMARVGIEITDSPYVVANMRIMTHMGQIALEELGNRHDFVKGIHSVVTLNPAERYISHFPAENLVISVNSNYGGNALLGKKCFALRLASVLARDEGWMAEHMLIIGITDPSGRGSRRFQVSPLGRSFQCFAQCGQTLGPDRQTDPFESVCLRGQCRRIP